ncbi:hypothetical protein RF55_9905 [Lasius niger]|uniref:Uncharacterized protein n=1 Tax=Lasius niger TaxID=67767 RepID=A0A0J7KJF2_LASNI|nr:hypothetical protein RF55_9905 [Lasius niger]
MDGLPISKSSPLKFWPILGRLIGSENEPFGISIYFGRTDPIKNFVVLKFVPDDDDSNNIYYDIDLTKWLIGVNEDMEGETYWPPHNVEAGSLVRKEKRNWVEAGVERQIGYYLLQTLKKRNL